MHTQRFYSFQKYKLLKLKVSENSIFSLYCQKYKICNMKNKSECNVWNFNLNINLLLFINSLFSTPKV